MSKAAFWDDFATLVNKVLLRRYQWIIACNAGHDNDLGRFPLGEQFDDLQTDDILCQFLSGYAQVCASILQVDIHLLSQPRPEDIYSLPLFSQKHLRHLHTLLRPEKAPVFHLLHKEYAADTREMNSRIHRAFLAANGARNLLRLADEAFHQVPNAVQSNFAILASQICSSIGWSIHELPTGFGYSDRSHYYQGALKFFHKYSSDLFNLSRTTDSGVARDLIQFFSTLVSELCHWDETIAVDLVNRFLDFRDPESPTVSSIPEDVSKSDPDDYRSDPASFPVLVANAWRFKVLRKYVVKGKMDLRVMSIATMDAALVELWREYSNLDPSCKQPVMQYLADFLLHGQVVDYIVSVDSHPQLISRSGNIVGFLVVTHRWSNDQADAIWNTVSENPDPRVVTATMTMLRSIVSLMGPADQLYLCKKLYNLSIARYTLDILRFLRDLSAKLMERVPPIDFTAIDADARPWNVCIRMIRDTVPGRDADKNLMDLHHEANEQLRTLIHIVPVEERHAIYRECAHHIANRSENATGSVRVIYVLAAPLSSGDGVFFQQNAVISRQILKEISSSVKAESEVEPSPYQMIALRYRLELLALMICRAGPAIPIDLYEELWDHTVGKYAISNAARDLAWTNLLQTIKVSPDNDFCQSLISSYVSTMEPRFYTSSLFEFVANYNFPTTRQQMTTENGEMLILQIPGGDLLWSMVLASPEGTIEDRAARLLAARYVQISETEGVHLSEVEAAHVVLVEKCMQELRSTSKLLRNQPNSGPSAMDLDVTTLEGNLRESEIRFGRILLFQKLLLECIRQKPEFNRGRRADSKIDAADVPFGDAITIRYQCGNDRQSVMMASDHTLEDLYKRLCHATGYTKINLFAKGQRLTIATNPTQKISDTDFGGQLLIQRAEGAEATRPLSGPIAGSSVFETSVVEHFDELFELMNSDDAMSQMIFDFLSFFPHRNSFADTVLSGEAQMENLFPPGKFFQARYAAQALQSRLREQIRVSSLSEKFLANAIHQLDAALLNSQLMRDPISSFPELRLAAVLVNVLLEFLRGKP